MEAAHRGGGGGGAARGQLLHELSAVKRQISLDDARLRRALTQPVLGENHQHVARAAAALRDEVAELNALRVVNAAQVRELERGNAQLEALAAELGRGGGGDGRDGGERAARRWVGQLQTMAEGERERRTGLAEEQRILRAELGRVNDEIQSVMAETEMERSRRQQAERECDALEKALEEGSRGKELISELIEEVQSLKQQSLSSSGSAAGSSHRGSRGSRSRHRGTRR